MCIGAVVVWPGGGGGNGCVAGGGREAPGGGGGGAERIDCDGGGMDARNLPDGDEPFALSRGCPSAPNAPERVAELGAAGAFDGAVGGVLMIASMLARSASFVVSGAASDSADVSAFFSFSVSLSKTCVASWSSSQSISSFAPFFAFAAAGGAALDGPVGGRTAGRDVLERAVGGGTFELALGASAPPFDGMLGSDPRPGGGGGLLGVAARIEPDGGGFEALGSGSGGGFDAGGGGAGAAAPIEPDGRAEGGGGRGGGCEADGGAVGGGVTAGPGIPSSVFFASSGAERAPGGGGAFDVDAGGGGGAPGERSADFFPRPSKMSRSEPFFVSFDIASPAAP
jgi:hypothetical protein